MRKFILIDHSIKDASGHHLEYALRVLRAAKNEGLHTILAVNKSCKDLQFPFVDVVERQFTYTFWENITCKKDRPEKSVKSLRKYLTEKKDQIIYNLLFSQLGIAHQLLLEGHTVSGISNRYHLTAQDQQIHFWAIASAKLYLELSRWYRKGKTSPKQIFDVIGKLKHVVQYIFKVLGGISLFPVILIFLLSQWSRASRRFNDFSALFGKECGQLLERLNTTESSIIFIPTLGSVELMGISKCSHTKTLQDLNWHLLFRRNFFSGKEPNYLSEMPTIKLEHLALAEFKQNFIYGKVYLYTDTDTLTEQYNLLGAYTFQTLPIPLDENVKKTTGQKAPLIISYVGDARDEKGFQFLSKLVWDIRAAGYSESQIRFRFQCNFNVQLGEPASKLAKAELSLMQSENVEMLEGPFNSDQYRQLINTSDILLVPYNENNYYARSSGVFAEALGAGVPVIYPAKSWMGRELLEENLRYWKGLESLSPATPWINIPKPFSHKFKLTINPSANNNFLFFRYELTSEHPGHYVKLNLHRNIHHDLHAVKQHEQLEFAGSIIIDMRKKKGLIFYCLDKPGDYFISLIDSNDPSLISNQSNILSYFVDIQYRLTNMLTTFPQQSVGYGYDTIDDLGHGVIDIIKHYEEYEQSCLDLSLQWSRFHNSNKLVQILLAKGER